jgi:uncharacterized membrane protein
MEVAAEWAIVVADGMALAFIVVGTIEAFVLGGRTLISTADGHRRRDAWLRYGRWLVAALTFQLAADIVETSSASSWDDLGRLAAIALIRTFLNYFLERDLQEGGERKQTARA